MDSIQTALYAFENVKSYEYVFTIAHNKKLFNFKLSFDNKDFHHVAGLHYLKDIDIPKSHQQLFSKIKSGKINDEYLEKSKSYLRVENNDVIVKNRIHDLRFIEQFLDSKNLIFKYVKYMNVGSTIDAEYLIKSTYNNISAYIFIRKRSKQDDNYCICSFFTNPKATYIGQKAYWQYKAKTHCASGNKEVFIDKLNKEYKEQ